MITAAGDFVDDLKYIGLCKLTDQIFLGSALEARNTELLKDAGITTVCNLTREEYGTDREAFRYTQIDHDDTVAIPRETIDKFLNWMDERMDAGDKVLIHCHAGISRTPSFIIAWQMHRAGAGPNSDLRQLWSKFEDRIGEIRPIIQPHHLLKKSILNYFGFVYVWPGEVKKGP